MRLYWKAVEMLVLWSVAVSTRVLWRMAMMLMTKKKVMLRDADSAIGGMIEVMMGVGRWLLMRRGCQHAGSARACSMQQSDPTCLAPGRRADVTTRFGTCWHQRNYMAGATHDIATTLEAEQGT